MLKAIDFLKKADICGIYSIGLRCQVWLHLPQKSDDREMRTLLNRDLKLLMDGLNSQGANRGLWDYGAGHGDGKFTKGRLDHSVSQYGVLGLWRWNRQRGGGFACLDAAGFGVAHISSMTAAGHTTRRRDSAEPRKNRPPR